MAAADAAMASGATYRRFIIILLILVRSLTGDVG
jgi:hypothetical protein